MSDFERLKQQQQTFILECESKINQWKKFQQDYISLKERLKTLPDELKYDIMVPFGRLAFMPGKLVKTNEVLVLLGDNWFVERSTKQSCDIIDRRLIGIEKHLGKLQKEIKMYNDQLSWTSNVIQGEKDYVNIEEKLDDNENDSSKSKLKPPLNDEEKRKQRDILQKKAQDAQKKINERIQAAKLTRTNVEEDDEEDETEDVNKMEEDKKQNEENQPKKKVVHWSDTNLSEKASKIVIDNNQKEIENYDDSSEDSVYDLSEEKSNVIYIKHTPVDQISNETKQKLADDSEALVKTPGDIYHLFYKPKSILKAQSSFENVEDEGLKMTVKNDLITTEETNTSIFEPLKAFTGEIVEHTEMAKETIKNLPQPTKKVSRFKASKQQ